MRSQVTEVHCTREQRAEVCNYKILQAADKPIDCDVVVARAKQQKKIYKKICYTKWKRLVIRPFLRVIIACLKIVVNILLGALMLLLKPLEIVVAFAR